MDLKRIFALSLIVISLVPAVARAQAYTVTDLGPLAPTAINTWAQVVGNYNQKAYLWTRSGGMKNLGVLAGGTSSHAAAINDLGAVTGTADGPFTIISPYADFGFPNVDCTDLTQPFLWTPTGGMRGLGTVVLSGDGQILSDYSAWCDISFSGQGINILGQVVGYTSSISTYQFGFAWTKAGGTSTFGGSYPPTFINGISDSGLIVGENGDCEAVPQTCFFGGATTWKQGVATNLGSLGGEAEGYGSAANGVNDLGQVVGWSTTAPINPGGDIGWTGEVPIHALLWSASGAIRDLGTLPGDSFSAASKINLFGLVVGVSGNAVAAPTDDDPRYEIIGRPFIWCKSSGIQDLNTLIPGNSGWVLNSAADINIWGQIVGSGTHNGEPRGFLLTPRVL